jgi:hypothetical protein
MVKLKKIFQMWPVLLQSSVLPPIHRIDHPHALEHKEMDILVGSFEFPVELSSHCT